MADSVDTPRAPDPKEARGNTRNPYFPPPEHVVVLRAYENVDQAKALLLALEMALAGLDDSEARYAIAVLAQQVSEKLTAAITNLETEEA